MQAGSQGDCSAGLLIMSERQCQAEPPLRRWINQEGSVKPRKSTQRLQAQHYPTAQLVMSLNLVLFSKLLLPFYSLTLHASFQKSCMPGLLCAILSYYRVCPQFISNEHFLPPSSTLTL